MNATETDSRRLEVMDQVVSCTNCPLHSQCLGPVPFHGPTPARIAVLGEAPGEQEDEQCHPFVGASGEMIRKHLSRVGIDADSVAYLNTASCFPHGTPSIESIEACEQNKLAQLDLIDPDFVLVLGKVACFGQRPEAELRRLRGTAFKSGGRVNFATYHPSAALRNRNYEQAMAEDLDDFAAIVRGDRMWAWSISDRCVICGKWPDADLIDEATALNYCDEHAPAPLRDQMRLWNDRFNKQSA